MRFPVREPPGAGVTIAILTLALGRLAPATAGLARSALSVPRAFSESRLGRACAAIVPPGHSPVKPARRCVAPPAVASSALMLRDRYPYWLANRPLSPNYDLVVTDKYSSAPAARVALADRGTIDA